MPDPTPEQMAALQEKIKNMSPEELREFQKQQCIFCHIVEGKVQSRKVYEDDRVIAILDINPANPGHLLLIPKEHYAIMPQIPEDLLDYLAKVTKHLSGVLIKALQAEGTTIFIANGVAAGQRAQHFMVHIIPRKENDNLDLEIPEKKITEQELAKIKKVIMPAINKALFGQDFSEQSKDGMGQVSEQALQQKLVNKPEIKEAVFREEKEIVKQKKQQQKKTKQKEEKKEASLDDIADLLVGK